MIFGFGFFTLIILGYQISGAHYNPCITVVSILRQSERSSEPTKTHKALMITLYLVAQLGGCFLATIIIGKYHFTQESIFVDGGAYGWPVAAETLGTAVLVFIYLSK